MTAEQAAAVEMLKTMHEIEWHRAPIARCEQCRQQLAEILAAEKSPVPDVAEMRQQTIDGQLAAPVCRSGKRVIGKR